MAATVHVIVATTVMLLVSSARANNDEIVSCTQNQVLQTSVTKPGAVLKLQCPSSYTISPTCTPKVGNVFSDDSCSNMTTLSDLCPGASGTQASATDNPVVLTFPQLPKNETTFYFKCTQSSNWCKFAVTVSAAPPGGPQVCAVKNTSVALALKGEGGTTQFACGAGLELNPANAKKVYDGNCTEEEDLKDMTLTGSSDSYYMLKADKAPKDQTICYVCGAAGSKGMGAETCAVLISVSAGSGLAALSVFGLALPCVLALLHFT
ncbi:merozoite 31 kDa surface antigen-like [Physeter macrocephalus]|uniref:Merozoite 31 kDa surface antigen-like n=1 Tax=Physeter macrocephalus TaxID=9755 RepID=A0A455B4F6_PHYMC|nr:merozoite 31 kDa surface antigen-like [Physeter catodon]|eukprot:XP_028343454.1 merozoite 31 kDa surface antigen-like [Physeter catodon]